MKNFFTKVRDLLHDPKFTTDFHKWATILWILLLIPSVLWWNQAILWIVLMSVWANIGSHWAAYQASRAELKQDNSTEETSCPCQERNESISPTPET